MSHCDTQNIVLVLMILTTLGIFYFLTKLRYYYDVKSKGKVLPQQAEVVQWVSGRLRPWIFLTLGTTKGGKSSALLTDHLYPRRNTWYSFLEAESTPGHMVLSVATERFQKHHRESIPRPSD
jgi:hypothetical protein